MQRVRGGDNEPSPPTTQLGNMMVQLKLKNKRETV